MNMERVQLQVSLIHILKKLLGLVVAKLIDFDQDRQQELFCSYRSMDDAFAPIAHQTVYGVKNGSVQILFHEDAVLKEARIQLYHSNSQRWYSLHFSL